MSMASKIEMSELSVLLIVFALLVLAARRTRRNNYSRTVAIVREVKDTGSRKRLMVDFLDPERSQMKLVRMTVPRNAAYYVGDAIDIRYCRGITGLYTIIGDSDREENSVRRFHIAIGMIMLLAGISFYILGTRIL